MSGSGKAGNGHGNNRRRQFRRKDNDSWQGADAPKKAPPVTAEKRGQAPDPVNQGRQNRGGFSRKGENSRGEQNRAAFYERPKWAPPKMNTEPLPVPACPWCGKPIRDISQAISDRDTGEPVHFDCVAAKIAGREKLEKGESITYIGAGRFGIVRFGYPALRSRDSRDKNECREFKIKKIIEWENKDQRAEWRSVISDHYSVT